MVFSVKKNGTTSETTYNRLRSLGFTETEEGFYIEMNNFGNANKRKTAREANQYRKLTENELQNLNSQVFSNA